MEELIWEEAAVDAAAAECVKPRTEVERRLVRLFSSSNREEAFSYEEWAEWARAHGASNEAIALYWEDAKSVSVPKFLYLNPEVEEKDSSNKYEYIPPKYVNRQATFGDAGAEMSFTGNTRELRAYLRSNCPNFYRNMFVFALNKPDAPVLDWFGSYDNAFLQQRLADNGFVWTREVVRLTNPDRVKEPEQDNQLPQRYEVDWSELNNLPEENVF